MLTPPLMKYGSFDSIKYLTTYLRPHRRKLLPLLFTLLVFVFTHCLVSSVELNHSLIFILITSIFLFKVDTSLLRSVLLIKIVPKYL